MGGKSSAPAPPDPKETSAASTSTNVGTAIANAFMGNVNQNTPDGSLRYDQTGTYTWNDPYTGRTYEIPRFTATQTLSPEQQAIRNQQLQAQTNLAGLARQQSGFLQDYLARPADLSNEATEARLYDLGSRRLDPRFAREEESLRTRLTNQGIREGSEAYNNALTQFGQGKNDAYNSLLLQGRGQAVQEALAQRNQPINEITALLSGSQVSQPNFVNTQQPTIPTTDTAGIINSNYNQRLSAWQQEQQQSNALLGGLFGLGSAGIFKWSDRRLKTDIKKIGETTDGQNLYSYRYKGDSEPQIGLMAQEVERRDPGAVIEVGGVKAVNYDRALPAMGSILRAA